MDWRIGSRALLAGAALGLLWASPDAGAQIAGRTDAQPAQAQAQVQPAPPQPAAPPRSTAPRIVDEFKVGLVAHDVGFLGHHKEGGLDFNGEILFASPDFLKYIWKPRPHFGVEINGSGNTNQYYAGLTWGGTFYQPNWSRNDGFFAYLALGGSVNDGKETTSNPHRKQLGSHVLFREGLDLGYQFNDVISLSSYIDHISNARLANKNEGITSIGARIGYKF
jgi:lipid A 3-O-deacylase